MICDRSLLCILNGTMKTKIIYLLTATALSASLFQGCDREMLNDLYELQEQADCLNNTVSKLNEEISSIGGIVSELQNGGYVKEYKAIIETGETIGYQITFGDGNSFVVYNGKNGADGKDGYVPSISVKQDSDGVLYWTLDGDWLKDGNGNKIRVTGKDGEPGADGITPQFKIVNDYWYVSYNDGGEWVKLYPSRGEPGAAGASFFQSVVIGNNTMVLTLSDGTVLNIPLEAPFGITLSSYEVEIPLSGSSTIEYTLNGAGTNPAVFAKCTSGDLRTSVTRMDNSHGTITITATDESEDTEVIVWASNGTTTVMAVIEIKLV